MADKEQVKNAIDSLGSTFEEFKKTNDERLAQIEKKGSADAVTSEKLARIEKDLDKKSILQKVITDKCFDKYFAGMEVIKEIYVENRLVNFVVKPKLMSDQL